MKRLIICMAALGILFAMSGAAEARCSKGKVFRGKGRQAVKAVLRGAKFVLPPYGARGGDGACATGKCWK